MFIHGQMRFKSEAIALLFAKPFLIQTIFIFSVIGLRTLTLNVHIVVSTWESNKTFMWIYIFLFLILRLKSPIFHILIEFHPWIDKTDVMWIREP